MVEGPIEGVTREKMLKAMKKTEPGKDVGLSEERMEMLSASGETGVACWTKEQCHLIGR